MKHWSELAPPLTKGEKIPMTEEYFYKLLAMDDELIHEQKEEIAKLKVKINKLELKLQSKKMTINNIRNKSNDKTR